MAEETQPKWEGKATVELKGPTSDQIWPFLEDFCNLQKWLPVVDTCYQLEGELGKPGLIRYCGCRTLSSDRSQEETKIIWAKEKLTMINLIERCLSYEILENNVGFKSYVATMKVLSINDGDGQHGCKIEWSFVADPIEGWPVEDFNSYINSSLQLMGQKMEQAVLHLDDDLEMTISAMGEILHKRRRTSLHRGSVYGHAYIWRDRVHGHHKLFHDYFGENPVYSPKLFRRRFRMSRSLFLRIQSAVEVHDSYFVQKRDAAGFLGLSSLQKITAALRMLSYGVAADYVDEYVRIGESTAVESLKKFVKAIVAIFSENYMRSPTQSDIQRLLKEGENRGFPGMLGSIDCMHWKWKNCPVAWKGMYVGHVREPTIVLEAIASYDLWIWHAFFGLPGSHNDINVLDRSFLFTELAEGRAPPANYSINGHDYTIGYYLADGIYPPWSTFVKTIPYPHSNKHKQFAAAQESARKDVERAFRVLQARFAIVRGPARFWHRETLKDIMKACIILHNMIIEDERHLKNFDYSYDAFDVTPNISISHEHTAELLEFVQCHRRIRDRDVHSQLQQDLIEHIWKLYESHM